MILIKRRSVVLTMPHRKLKAVGKAHAYRYGNSSPRYSVRTTMLSLYTIQKFLRFPLYKISITPLYILICLGDGIHQIRPKITKLSRHSHVFWEKLA